MKLTPRERAFLVQDASAYARAEAEAATKGGRTATRRVAAAPGGRESEALRPSFQKQRRRLVAVGRLAADDETRIASSKRPKQADQRGRRVACRERERSGLVRLATPAVRLRRLCNGDGAGCRDTQTRVSVRERPRRRREMPCSEQRKGDHDDARPDCECPRRSRERCRRSTPSTTRRSLLVCTISGAKTALSAMPD